MSRLSPFFTWVGSPASVNSTDPTRPTLSIMVSTIWPIASAWSDVGDPVEDLRVEIDGDDAFGDVGRHDQARLDERVEPDAGGGPSSSTSTT